jgi:hypothetical protein
MWARRPSSICCFGAGLFGCQADIAQLFGIQFGQLQALAAQRNAVEEPL